MKGEAEKLNPKQQRFIEEYLVDCNATKAAIRSGYSEKTAAEQGSRLLTNVKVKEAIDKRLNILSNKALSRREKILAELERIAFGNLTEYGVNEYGEPRMRLPDKLKALDMAARMEGMYEKDANKQEEEPVRTWEYAPATEDPNVLQADDEEEDLD